MGTVRRNHIVVLIPSILVVFFLMGDVECYFNSIKEGNVIYGLGGLIFPPLGGTLVGLLCFYLIGKFTTKSR